MNTAIWTKQIDGISDSFSQEFGHWNDSQLNRNPSPGKWSVAQILQHLITVNESYYPVLERVRKGSNQLPWHAQIGFITNLMGKFVLRGVQPDRKKSFRTFSIWEPPEGDMKPGILDKFLNHQKQLKKMIVESNDLLDEETVISSPANRNIVYKLETAFHIIVSHELRHLQQAGRLSGNSI